MCVAKTDHIFLLYPPEAWFRSVLVSPFTAVLDVYWLLFPLRGRRHSPPPTMLRCSRRRRSFAGATSALVTYPLDLARARLAVGHSRKIGGARRRRYAQDLHLARLKVIASFVLEIPPSGSHSSLDKLQALNDFEISSLALTLCSPCSRKEGPSSLAHGR